MDKQIIEERDFVLHFKNELDDGSNPITKYMYAIKALAINANNDSNGNIVVVYKNIMTGKIYTRNYDEFISEVNHEKYPNIKQKFRFQKCNVFGKLIEDEGVDTDNG